MKYIQLFISLFFLACITWSCEDVIDIELQDADSQIVIDAWINNLPEDQEITLTISQQYFDNTNPTGLTGADVYLIRSDGTVFDFIDTQNNGKYEWISNGSPLGNVGDSFELKILDGSDTYTGTSVIKRVPTLDSLAQEYRENEIFLDDGIYVEFFARDFVGLGDSYWIKSFKNDRFLSKASEMNIAFDAGFDAGSGIDGLIFIPPVRQFVNELDSDGIDIPWQSGDVSRVEIHSINRDAFNFLEIARDQINNGSNGIFSLPLANTRSNLTNITGTAKPLGFFNIAAISSKEVIIE